MVCETLEIFILGAVLILFACLIVLVVWGILANRKSDKECLILQQRQKEFFDCYIKQNNK